MYVNQAAQDGGASRKRSSVKGCGQACHRQEGIYLSMRQMDEETGRWIKNVGQKNSEGEGSAVAASKHRSGERGGQMLSSMARVQDQGPRIAAGAAGAGMLWQMVENRNSKCRGKD